MKARKTFLLRISPKLYESLEAWAQQELRSVNGQIEYILKEAVVKRDRKRADLLVDVEPDGECGQSEDDTETSPH